MVPPWKCGRFEPKLTIPAEDRSIAGRSRRIGTIEGCDIVEQDDKSVTFTAAARLDGDGANGQFGQPPCYATASPRLARRLFIEEGR